MSKLLCLNPGLRVLEKQMQEPPGYRPREYGICIIESVPQWPDTVCRRDCRCYRKRGMCRRRGKELFYRVQEELARRAAMNKAAVTRKKNQKSKFSSEYALTGLLLCGDCGPEYRRVTWSRNGKKKIVWRCSNRLTNGTKHCKKSETLEEVALNRAIMEP